MRIALIITSLSMGGAETQVVDLADQLSAHGHEVLLISMTSELVMQPRDAAVQVRTLAMTKTAASVCCAYLKAVRLLRDFGPAVLHSHMVHANIFSRLLQLAYRTPRLICTAHSTNEGSALWMWAYRLTDSLAHMTTNVSQEAVRRAVARSAVSPRRVMAVYNGIDCERFRFDPVVRNRLRSEHRTPVGTQVLLAAGRFCDAKDYPNLLHAFREVCTQREDCHLWIAGGGGMQGESEALAGKLNLLDRVRFLGFRRDVDCLMSAADVFVLSSAWEGFPLVIGEAMACERVVVATDAGGVREWLEDTGYIVPTRDSSALAKALLVALTLDTEARTRKGREARSRVEQQYSLLAAAERWERIYQGDYGPGAPNLPAI
jgi:glycosyltransferase involved in cell wall biosynthesis